MFLLHSLALQTLSHVISSSEWFSWLGLRFKRHSQRFTLDQNENRNGDYKKLAMELDERTRHHRCLRTFLPTDKINSEPFGPGCPRLQQQSMSGCCQYHKIVTALFKSSDSSVGLPVSDPQQCRWCSPCFLRTTNLHIINVLAGFFLEMLIWKQEWDQKTNWLFGICWFVEY